MLDWSKLKPYNTSKAKSYEQLCYQIAARFFADRGMFTPIDDSGGGDGVEFYLTLDSGEQWGWQTKYYENSPRLRDSNRKAAISGSLKKTLRVHPALTQWFLCLPMDLTVDENHWVEQDLIKDIPADRELKIIVWSHTAIHGYVNQPQFSGIWQAFFNALELSPDWFENAFARMFAVVSNKFDELLYVPNEEFEHSYLHPMLCDGPFRQRIDQYVRLIQEKSGESLAAFDDLNFRKSQFQTAIGNYQQQMMQFNLRIATLATELTAHAGLVYPNTATKLHPDDYDQELEELTTLMESAGETVRQEINIVEAGKTPDQLELEQHRKLWAFQGFCKEVLQLARHQIRDSCLPVKWQIGHFLGQGGTGKTNFCVAVARQYLAQKHPVVFIPAIKLTGSHSLSEQILGLLDVKTGYTFTELLDTLNTLGEIYNVRVPLVLDGLNEALNSNGRLNTILSTDLPGLEADIRKRPNLILITTCRSSYRDFIWPDGNGRKDDRFHPLYGFTDYEDKKELVHKYFTTYKLQADYSFDALEPFTNPLYLKIFCETMNPERAKIKQVVLAHHSIYSIFDQFIQRCDKSTYQKLLANGKPPLAKYRKLASGLLAEIASALWSNFSRSVTMDEFIGIADPEGIEDFDRSVTKALLEEELLFIRDVRQDKEYVYLTYDLMAGYLIADHLMKEISDYPAFFRSLDMVTLVNVESLSLHPHYEDVLNALCTLMPLRNGAFAHDLANEIGDSENRQKLVQCSLKATLLLPPEHIPKKQIEVIAGYLENDKNFNTLLRWSEPVLFVTGHPFNFKFFDPALRKMSMNTRDVTWTEYLRNQENDLLPELMEEFERLHQQSRHTAEQRDKLQLASGYLIWNLTSTNKADKRKISALLLDYGKKYPKAFLAQYKDALTINDPTIFEWLSLLCYQLVLYLIKQPNNSKELFIDLVTFLDKNLFDPRSHFSTNHLQTRERCYRIMEEIGGTYPDVCGQKMLTNVKANFPALGVTDWEFAADRNEEEYRDGNGLIHHNFHKSHMARITDGSSAYQPSELYLTRLGYLRWRAYALGYTLELFGDHDMEIANLIQSDTERYADKYIEIAYQELCGYLTDRDLLRDYSEAGYLRPDEPKFEEESKDERTLHTPHYITLDFIDETLTEKQWCSDKTPPDYRQFLKTKEFMEKTGDFALLYGFLHQVKPKHEKQIYFHIEALLVPKKQYSSSLKAFKAHPSLGIGHDVPQILHALSAEIPDGRAIPANKPTRWDYNLGDKMQNIHYQRIDLIQHGKLLSRTETRWTLGQMSLKTGYYYPHHEDFPAMIPFPVQRFAPGKNETYIELAEYLKEQGLEMKFTKYTSKELRPVTRTINLEYPVTRINHQVYTSKNIIDHLKLKRGSIDKDLYDQQGNLAAFSHRFWASYVDQEALCYLRRDLLEQYLKENNLEMFYMLSGERDWYPADGDWMKAGRRAQQRKWASLYDILPYPEI